MKYYKLLTFTLLFCLSACGGEKKDTDATQDSVETVLPDEANEVTIMTLKQTEFNHELISNGKLSARKLVDLRFESAEPIARIYVKNGDPGKQRTENSGTRHFPAHEQNSASQRRPRESEA